ncbi:MAG: tetratricopeptide repeat protein [Mangrovibacterium sp.]
MVDHKNQTTQEDNLQEVENVLGRTEAFIEKNQKGIVGVVAVIVVVAVAYMAYNNFIVAPKEQSALADIEAAQRYFDVDSFNLAINGDGTNAGFLDIIDNYGSTSTGNLANYYTGVSYARLGQFDEAIEYLNDFSTDDPLLAPISEGLKGDCQVELGNNSAAIKAYKKAVSFDNELTAPIYLLKVGQVYESEKNYKEALAAYQTIKSKYATSIEGRSIDKYIARTQVNLN